MLHLVWYKKQQLSWKLSWDDKVISRYDLTKTICICLLVDKK